MGRKELGGLKFISYMDIDRECGDNDCTECEVYTCIWNPFVDPEEESELDQVCP